MIISVNKTVHYGIPGFDLAGILKNLLDKMVRRR